MPSKLAHFANRLLETGWLAAVIVTPLFFNVWSNRVFEPDKLALLRTIALVMVAASAVLLAEVGFPGRAALARWLKTPVVIPVLVISAIYLVSSILSSVPGQSLTGGYVRLQGFFTWLAYVVVFLAIVSLLRNRLSLDRLVFALILPSLPVGLYGLIQKAGKEIMPWQGDTADRIASTMGNSIFVAAYLILVVPITLVKLTAALRDLDEKEGNAAVLRVSAYMVVLAIQVLAVVFSQSRGPLLGMLGSVFFLFLLLASLKASRRAMLTVLGLGAAVAAFLVVFNLPNSPLAPLRENAYVGRLGRVFETDRGTGRVRVLIWSGAVELIGADPMRTLIGWGPESMHVVYTPFYPPELGNLESRNASPDRAHNETFDALVTTGIVGFLGYLFLFTSVFYYGLKWLGLIEDARWGRSFLALWFGGGAASAAGFYLWSGNATYFGVALPAGLVAGLFFFVALRALLGWAPPERRGLLIMAGLMAGLIAHFIEINFGIAIAATRTLFFAMTAALVVVGVHGAEQPELLEAPRLAEAEATTRRRRARAPVSTDPSAPAVWTALGLLILTMMITLVFDFFVWTSLDAWKGIILAWLFLMAWGFGSLVLGTETLVLPGSSVHGIGRYLVISVGGTLAYILVHWSTLSGGQTGGADTSSVLVILYYCVLATVLVSWAGAMAMADTAARPIVRVRASWVYGLAFAATLAVAWRVNLDEVRADIYFKQAWVSFHAAATNRQNEGNVGEAVQWYDMAIGGYSHAMDLDGAEDYYQLFRGKALLEKADAMAMQLEATLRQNGLTEGDSEYDVSDGSTIAQVQARDNSFEEALAQLRRAQLASQLNTDHTANIGRAYQVWADRTFDSARRAERFDEARRYLQDAVALSPRNAGLLEELAMTEYLSGRPAEARGRISDSLAVDPAFGRPYRLLALMAREDEDWPESEKHYRAYFDTRDGRNDLSAWSGFAFVLGQQGKVEDAIAANQRVLELLGRADLDTLRNLTLLSQQAGDLEGACSYAARGLTAAEDPGLRAAATSMDCAALGVEVPPVDGEAGLSGQAADPGAPSEPAGPPAP